LAELEAAVPRPSAGRLRFPRRERIFIAPPGLSAKAAETLQVVLDNNPQHSSAWLMLACAREQMGMKLEAIDAYRQLREVMAQGVCLIAICAE
jgi:hypothetical protein